MYFDQLLPSAPGLALTKAASVSAQRDALGLGTAATKDATSIVQSVNGRAPDGSGNVATRTFTSGVVGAAAVVLFTTQTNSAPAEAVAVPLKQVLLVVMAVYAYLFL